MVRSVRFGIALFGLFVVTATVPALHAQSDDPAATVDDTAPSIVDAMPDQQLLGPMPLAAEAAPVPGTPSFPAPRTTKTIGCSSVDGLPDAACTPGAIDPRVTQDTIGATICMSGYTATVRPPVSVTNRIKREQMAAYGLEGQPLSAYELDHLISLELGGAPADVANLWPESWTGDGNAHQKDAVETHLKREVCAGTLALIEAQRLIATNWLAVYRGNGLQPAQ